MEKKEELREEWRNTEQYKRISGGESFGCDDDSIFDFFWSHIEQSHKELVEKLSLLDTAQGIYLKFDDVVELITSNTPINE